MKMRDNQNKKENENEIWKSRVQVFSLPFAAPHRNCQREPLKFREKELSPIDSSRFRFGFRFYIRFRFREHSRITITAAS